MIKGYKSDKAPEKLAEAGYTCDEVKQAILNDQKDKCYLCERKVTTDYQVEHIEKILIENNDTQNNTSLLAIG